MAATPARRWASAAFSLAQAAAIFAAVGLLGFAGRPSRLSEPAAVAVRAKVDIDPGEIVLIRLEGGRELQTVAHQADDSPDAVDAHYAMFNVFEAMTGKDSPSAF